MAKFYLVVAVVFGLAGGVIWLAFLRPVAEQVRAGTILAKRFRPAESYSQQQPGISRGMRTATEIPIAEHDVLEIAIDGRDGSVSHALNRTAGRSFSVGQRVRVTYVERGFGLFWRRVYVLDVEPVEPSPP